MPQESRAHVQQDDAEIPGQSSTDQSSPGETESRAECFCMGMGPQITSAAKMGSEKTREHFRTARIEFLKGLRNLLDERIDTLSKADPAQKGAKISVD